MDDPDLGSEKKLGEKKSWSIFEKYSKKIFKKYSKNIRKIFEKYSVRARCRVSHSMRIVAHRCRLHTRVCKLVQPQHHEPVEASSGRIFEKYSKNIQKIFKKYSVSVRRRRSHSTRLKAHKCSLCMRACWPIQPQHYELTQARIGRIFEKYSKNIQKIFKNIRSLFGEPRGKREFTTP